MFFIFAALGPEESSLLTSSEPAVSVTTLLCVIVVTVAMVVLTLMCVCSKKTASVKFKNDSAPVAEVQVKLKHLSTTEDVENQMTEAKTEEMDDGNSAASLPEGSIVPVTSTTQLAVTHLKEETRPASHPSPHLPPRNPHNFHASTHPNSQVSSRTSTPVSLEKVHDDHASSRTTATSSTAATGGAMATKESQPSDHSWIPCRVQPDYEEMDLPDKTPPANAKADECDDTNIYQDIDLNQESNSQKTAAKNSDSIEPYAEFKEESKKSSAILRPQRNSSSLQTSESDAPNGNKSSNEIPKYAKVDKSRKSQLASSNSSLANHLPEDGFVSQEVDTSCNGESRSSAPITNVTELYTQVHKPKGNVAVVSNEHDKDSHVSNSRESANCENSKVANGDMVLNPCYESTMLRNYPIDTTSGHSSTQPLVVPTAEESPYSTINDERVNATTNPDPNATTDPGYSSIYEVQGGSAATASATGGGNSSTGPISSPKEPIYELVDATATDEVSTLLSQRL